MQPKKKVLLIGGNGFIGSHLVDNLLRHNYQVQVLDIKPELYREPLEEVEYFYLDRVEDSVIEDITNDCHILIHLAHSTVPTSDLSSVDDDLNHNIVPFVKLLKSLEKSSLEKFIYFSSGGTVYGIPQETPISEDHPLRPISSYGVAKLTMESYLRFIFRQFNKNYIIIRPANPYGPRQNYLGRQGVIPIFMYKIIREEPITIWGSGDISKDYIYIEDLTSAVLDIMLSKAKNDIYNLGSGVSTSLMEIIKGIEMITGKKALIKWEEPRGSDVPHVLLDCSKYLQLVGPKAYATSLSEGLRATYRWLIDEQQN